MSFYTTIILFPCLGVLLWKNNNISICIVLFFVIYMYAVQKSKVSKKILYLNATNETIYKFILVSKSSCFDSL